LLLKCKYIRV